jgi:hypothetical protein
LLRLQCARGPLPRGLRGKGGRSRWGSGRSYIFQLLPAPTAPESAFCGRSRAEAVFLARLVMLRQKQLLERLKEHYQTHPNNLEKLRITAGPLCR